MKKIANLVFFLSTLVFLLGLWAEEPQISAAMLPFIILGIILMYATGKKKHRRPWR